MGFLPDIRRVLKLLPAVPNLEAHLAYEPDGEAANRKLLSPTSELEAEWELRFGPGNRFRVFYSVQHERREVYVVAIGIKRGNRLLIGREEVRL